MEIDLEQIFKMVVVGILLAYAIGVSTIFEVKYPAILVEMYLHPWWRLLLVVLIAVGWHWSPLVGILLAVIVFFYLHDMYILMSKQTKMASIN